MINIGISMDLAQRRVKKILGPFSVFVLSLFALIIFFSTVSFSTLSETFVFAQQLPRIINFCVLALALFSLLFPKTPRQIFFWILILAIVCINYYYTRNLSNFGKTLLIGLSMASLRQDFFRILKYHCFALLAGILLVVGLSIFGKLPISGSNSSVLFSSYQNIVYCFGFSHPNILGALMTMFSIEFSVCFLKNHAKQSALILVIAIILDGLIGANTAMVGALLYSVLIFFFQNKVISKIIYNITLTLPALIAGFALYLASVPGSAIFEWFNQHIESRPSLWNYYLLRFPPKVFEQKILMSLDSVSNFYGNGSFDGAYIYYLIYFGVIGLLALIVMLMAIDATAEKTHSNILFAVFISLVAMSFSETLYFLYFANAFIFLLFFYQLGIEERSILTTQKKIYLGKNAN
ncbi:hypothetical protein [Oenococcus oeni]|uniref:hypothetical protein n=1 Tax=Oenococcus oeni TaxID=1247 RepID=UPI0010B8E00D|nr:hypothetical protein [Oenococcus oeni]SYW14874.1 membrane hypothetical protein [Oenococcus oeni]